jgi:hypothetical protein
MIAPKVNEHPYGIKLEYVEGVFDSMNRPLASRELLMRALKAGVPFVSAKDSIKKSMPCVVIEGSRRFVVPIEEIESIHIPEFGNAKWIGLWIGAVVDVAVAVICVSTFKLG